MKVSEYLRNHRNGENESFDRFSEYASVFQLAQRASRQKGFAFPQSTKNALSCAKATSVSRETLKASSKSPNKYAAIAENRRVLQQSKAVNRRIRTESDAEWHSFVESQKRQLCSYESKEQPLIYIDLCINHRKCDTIPLYINTNIEEIVQEYSRKYDLPYSKS